MAFSGLVEVEGEAGEEEPKGDMISVGTEEDGDEDDDEATLKGSSSKKEFSHIMTCTQQERCTFGS